MSDTLQAEQSARTMTGMAKNPTSEQVRIPKDLTEKARTCAQVLHHESLPDYVARVLRDAVARDLPIAATKIDRLAKQTAEAMHPKRPNEKKL